MGVPTYGCPQSLLRVWWKPMEDSGFSVQLLPETRQAMPPVCQNVFSGGLVCSGQVTVRVTITETFGTAEETRGRDQIINLWFSRFNKNRHLAPFVERILLASGAKSFGRPFSC